MADEERRTVYNFSVADMTAACLAALPEGRLDEIAEAGDQEEIDRLGDQVAEAVKAALDESAGSIAASLKRDMARALAEHRADRIGFEARLYARWREALDLYEAVAIAAREMGEDFNRTHRPQAVAENDFIFEVLTRLHARACETISEVLALLRSGHASGAHARWRTLHEIAVTAFFIAAHDQEVANRYLLYENVESLKAARNYERCYPRLRAQGYKPLDPEEITRLEAHVAALVDKFGENFKKRNGWAAEALGVAAPSFEQIESAAGLDHIRGHYQLASHPVHASVKGITFNLGNPLRRNILPAGASNAGLADPGHGALISLVQCTVALIMTKPEPMTLMGMKALMQLEAEAGEAFLRVHDEILQEERENQPESAAEMK